MTGSGPTAADHLHGRRRIPVTTCEDFQRQMR
jgi:hypothetical protein